MRVGADVSGLNKGLTGAQRELDKFGRNAGRVAGLVGAGLFTGMVKSTIDAQNEMAQLNAVLRSTGGAAGFTVGQLDAVSKQLQSVTTFSDGAIKGAQALLLTFTQIKGAELTGATKAVLNVAQAMGTDLKSAAIQVGKALNDPILGLTSLSRSGIQFTADQKAVIKQMVAVGDTAGAQRVILKELETQFGGSADAARNTLGGALKALANSFDEALEVSGNATGGIVGAINGLADALPGIRGRIDGFFSWFNKAMIRSASLWQQLLANMRRGGLSIQQGIANSAQKSAFGGIRAWGERLEASTMAAQDEIDGLVDAIKLWEKEQLAAASNTGTATDTGIAKINGLTTATTAAATAARKLAAEWKAAKNEMERGTTRTSDVGAKGIAEAFKGEKAAKGAGGFADKASAEAAAKSGKGGGGGSGGGQSFGQRIGSEVAFTEMGQMVKAFAEFGPMAALIPVVNGAMEKMGPAFSKLMAPLVEFGAAIGEILAPVMEMLVPVIRLIVSSFKVFHPVLRMVVKGFSYLMQGLGMVVKAVGKLIDSLPFVKAPGIIRAGQEMIDAAKAARENADATDKATEAVQRFADSLSNIPRVLNVNALRHMITGGPSANGGKPWAPPDKPTFGNVTINVNGAGDPRRVAEEVGRVIERTGSRGGMTRLQVALA